MSESLHSLSQRESYTPTTTTRFLWWLSTAEKELLADCVVDRNRYAIIGTTVLATWLFASLAWTYFFATVIDNLAMAIGLGFFLGFIILSIDRALIKGINATNKRKIGPLLFRGVLALTIGTFMAQPALLYIFDKEIKLQTSLDNEKKRITKRQELDTLFAGQKTALTNEKNSLQQQLTTKYSEVAAARNNFIAETDGTGGSGKVGLKNIALAKKAAYDKLDADYQVLDARLQPRLRSIDSSLDAIAKQIKKDETMFEAYLNNGFLTRIEALNNLIKSNTALQFRYYLIVVILVLIELMPVIAKTMLPSGTYDEKVKWKELMEQEMVKQNMQKEQDLKMLYNQLAKEQDETFLQQFFAATSTNRQSKMEQQFKEWSNNKNESFDGFWGKVKRDMLTKQEY
jgi:hypothetical protein